MSIVNELKFNTDALLSLKTGADKLANAVKSTLGPSGRNVLIEKENGYPIITKDGVTVANSITFEDKYENIGATLMRGVSVKTDARVGDGTTTSIVLAQAILDNGVERLNNRKVNPILMQRGIEEAANRCCNWLYDHCKKADNIDILKKVALVSSNWDHTLADLISTAIDTAGSNGSITTEECPTQSTVTLDIKKGMTLDQGFISPHFTMFSDGTIVYENPYVLVYDKELNDPRELVNLYNQILTENGSLVLFVSNMSGKALEMTVVNALKAGLKVAVVRCPGYGSRQTDNLCDIATYVGCSMQSKDFSSDITYLNISEDAEKEVSSKVLGRASKIIITADSTTIIDGAGSKESIENRIKSINKDLENTTEEYSIEKLEERRARLASTVVTIKVGGVTPIEIKEKKYRIDDALYATKAAVKKGVIPGAGIMLLRYATEELSQYDAEDKSIPSEVEDINIQEGFFVFRDALLAPIQSIISNAGRQYEPIISSIKRKCTDTYLTGYDAINNKVVDDAVAVGVIDPVYVVAEAVRNAASIAGLLLTSSCVVINKESE